MVYNAPGIGITLTSEVIEQLAGIEGVVALKQGDLNPAAVDRLASQVVGRIRVLAASDLVFLGPLAAGFDGLSSTNSCALPEIILASFGALRAGDATRAGMLHRSWYPFRAVARALGQPQTTKAAMTLRGWTGGHVRLPLRDLDDTARAKVAEALAATEAQSKVEGTVGTFGGTGPL
jgi:4-hydroxy-tetrahydrodipicolinate synthase